MSDVNLINSGAHWDELLANLSSSAQVEVFGVSINEEPTYDFLEEIANLLRTKVAPDLIVGIGGGSSMDIAKGCAVLLANPGSAIGYRGFDLLERPGVPVVCIPTTAGSGSEATPNAVFTEQRTRKKMGINGRFVSAKLAVLDARWQKSLPKQVALSSGLDALVHALESFACRNATQFSRHFSQLAISLIFRSFENSLQDEEDLMSRQLMLEASYLAATALFNSGSGVSGALSYPIGVHFKVPHGFAGGVTLPHVVAWNVENGFFDYGHLVAVGARKETKDEETLAKAFTEKLFALYYKLGAPLDFSKWDITRSHLPAIMASAEALQSAFNQNPISFSATTDTRTILEQVLPA